MRRLLANQRVEIGVGIAALILLGLGVLAAPPFPPSRPSVSDAGIWIAIVVGMVAIIGFVFAVRQARDSTARERARQIEEDSREAHRNKLEELARHEVIRPLVRLQEAFFDETSSRPGQRGIQFNQMWAEIAHEAGQHGLDTRVMVVARDTSYFDLLLEGDTVLLPRHNDYAG